MKRALATLFTATIAVSPVVASSAPVDAAFSKPTPYSAARDAHGIPDLEGTWSNATLTPMERPKDLGARKNYSQAEATAIDKGRAEEIVEGDKPTDTSLSTTQLNATCEIKGFAGVNCGYNAGWTDPGDGVNRVGGQPRTSFITFPIDGRIPAGRPGVDPQPNRNPPGMGEFDNPENRPLGERCILHSTHAAPVLQPALYNNNYQIVQSKDTVALLVEQDHDVRFIRLNAKHRSDGVRPWMGDSIGHYEGPTLVVETTNFPKAQAMRGAWQSLKVTERFTRVAADRVLYQFKVEDPAVWNEPWGGEYEMTAAKGQIYEYACHEGNYSLEAILAGARAEETSIRQSVQTTIASPR